MIVFLAMCASAASVALLLRRIRWAPVLGVYTSLAVPVAVMPMLPNSAAISNWNFLLGLLLIVLPVAVIVNLSRQRTQDWFAAVPRPADARARNRRGITAAGQAAGLVLGAFLLAAYCNEVAPDAFW
ncbi:hypothetical protein [Glycomyces albidus]|uniref:hypothetical protein n=1 Tax=Glycomyces albidus TaxID=2656774 RepID=UPI0018848F71|nr:hypothetical protein [Glycomyces albidus]